MSKRALGICVAFLTAIAVAPASAAAYTSPAQGPTAELTVHGSHGYEVRIAIEDGSSTLSASKGQQGIAGANYFSLDGRAARGGAQARFGRLGRVKVRFRGSGEVQRRRVPPCQGRPELIRHGVFVGKIRFRGEGGYTEVDAARARGTITTVPGQSCALPESPGRNGGWPKGAKAPREVVFAAGSRAKGVQLEATRVPNSPEESVITASSYQLREGMTIIRSVLLFAPLGAFSFDAGLNAATLHPPAPFSGSASFTRIDDYASRWEGPLTISLPGQPDVPLTGRDFSWSLRSQRASASSTVIAFGSSTLGDR
jgi:hypothetical protein